MAEDGDIRPERETKDDPPIPLHLKQFRKAEFPDIVERSAALEAENAQLREAGEEALGFLMTLGAEVAVAYGTDRRNWDVYAPAHWAVLEGALCKEGRPHAIDVEPLLFSQRPGLWCWKRYRLANGQPVPPAQVEAEDGI